MSQIIIRSLGWFFSLLQKSRGCIAVYQKSKFASCGKGVHVGHDCEFTLNTIYCGNHVHIGPRASFKATLSKVIIGDYVLFGPNVTIVGGDHRIDVIGKHIYEVKDSEKKLENDADVIIGEGAWIGCNVTILKGVTIGKGAVVAAGSVVNKSIPPYSICGGVPAKVLKYRFSEYEIREHETKLRESH